MAPDLIGTTGCRCVKPCKCKEIYKIVICNGAVYRLTIEMYIEMLRRLSVGEVFHLPDMGQRICTISLNIFNMSKEEASKYYEWASVEVRY